MNSIKPLTGLFLCLMSGCVEEGGKDVTIVTGYENAVIEDTIYIPFDLDVKQPTYERERDFRAVGPAFQMWAGVIDTNETLIETGHPIRTYHRRIELHMDTAERTNLICASLSGSERALACATLGDVCHIYIAFDAQPSIWGHEASHCLKGDWHK